MVTGLPYLQSILTLTPSPFTLALWLTLRYTIYQEVNDDGKPDWGEVSEGVGRQWRLWKLLEEINPVTDVGGPHGYMVHRATHQDEHGRERRNVDLLHLCANCPGLIT